MNTKEIIATVGVAALIIAGAAGLSEDEIKSFDFNEKTIACAYTDENAGESLIIKTDAKTYGGWDATEVFFSIENISGEDEIAYIQLHFAGDETVADISELKKEVPYQITVRDYGVVNYECEKWVKTIDDIEGVVYECGKERRYCDSVEGTTCTVNNTFIGTHEETRYEDKWCEISFSSPISNDVLIPKKFTPSKKVSYQIPNNEVRFFKANVNFPAKSNGEFWISAKGVFGSEGRLDPWYSSSYAYKKSITVQNGQVFETDTAFPVLVSVTDVDLKSTGEGGNVAQADGYDIIFVNGNEDTLLDFEIESWEAATGKLVAWVQTEVNSGADKTFYMYYGNASATDISDAVGTWDGDFKAVWHLSEDPSGTPPQMLDSTSNNNDGTSGGTMLTEDQVAGQIDGNLDFDGSDDYITAPDSSELDGFTVGATWSFWMNTDVLTRQTFLSKYHTGSERAWFIEMEDVGTEDLSLFVSSDTDCYDAFSADYNLSINTWYHIAIVWISEAKPKMFVGGVERTVAEKSDGCTGYISSIANSAWAVEIGRSSYNAERDLNGNIDEVRISNVARSANWIKTDFNNQDAPASFLDFGSEVQQADTCFFGVNF